MWKIVFICLLVLGLVFRPNPAHACSPSGQTNYWYDEVIDFDSADLPQGVQLIPQPKSEESEPATFEIQTAFDDIYLIYNKDKPIFKGLFPGGGDYLEALKTQFLLRSTLWLRLHNYVPEMGQNNPQSPGGRDEQVPGPLNAEIWFATPYQLIKVPITVSYSLNSNYDESYLPYAAPLEDAAIHATNIVVATGIEELPIDEDSYNSTGLYQVESWLKGEGEEIIEMGYFGNYADCHPPFIEGHYIFFLEEAEDGVYEMLLFNGVQESSDENIERVINQVGQEPITFPKETPVLPTATLAPPTNTPQPTIMPQPTQTPTLELEPEPTATDQPATQVALVFPTETVELLSAETEPTTTPSTAIEGERNWLIFGGVSGAILAGLLLLNRLSHTQKE